MTADDVTAPTRVQSSDAPRPSRLRRNDPPGLGAAEITGRLRANDSGVIYSGRLDGRVVTVVMLTSGAERDGYARTRFLRAVEAYRSANPSRVAALDADDDIAPWVALAGTTEEGRFAAAERLLAPVALDDVSQVGTPRGPRFRPHWADRNGAGRWRLWPLPWPSALQVGAWWTYLVSMLLIALIATMALFIAIKVFEDQPAPPGPVPPPPGLPTDGPGPTQPTPTETTPTDDTGGTPTPTDGTREVPPIV